MHIFQRGTSLGSDGKESACKVGDVSLTLDLGKSGRFQNNLK